MKRAVAVFVAGCIFLSTCGTNGATQGPAPPASLGQATAQPIGTQPTTVPTPAQESTMDASEPTRENPAPAEAAPATSQAPAPTAQPTGAARPAFQATPIAAASTATPAASTPLDPTMAGLVAGAQADLAKRRSVALDAIEVAEVRSVTWPDPSLGCPQPGMAYRQVPVDGVLIRLRVSGMIFNYHGGGGRAPFLCEQPAQDSAPAPQPGLGQ